ncbi:hypothetical protein Tco_1538859 [Tanacetum coccineum]
MGKREVSRAVSVVECSGRCKCGCYWDFKCESQLPRTTQDHLQIFNKRILEWATKNANKGCEATQVNTDTTAAKRTRPQLAGLIERIVETKENTRSSIFLTIYDGHLYVALSRATIPDGLKFRNTLGKDSKTGVYSFQLDELWFNLNVDLLRKALGITPKDSTHPFVPPPAGDLPWRTILSMINQCLTGKTSDGDRPRHPVLQMLWGVFTGTNVDYARLIWEEFLQAIKNFFFDAANLKNSEYYEKYMEMVARKPRQPTTKTGEEGGKMKKAPEADNDESWQGKEADHLVEEEDEESKPATEPQVEDDECILERGIQISLESLHEQGQGRQALISGVAIRKTDPGLIRELLEVEGKGKGIFSEEQAAQSLLDLQNPKKKSITHQYIFQRRTSATQDASTGPSAQPQDDTSANVVYDTSSPADFTNDADNVDDMELSTTKADTEILNVDEKNGEEVSHTVALEERNVELDEGQARSVPGKTPES